MNVILSCPSKTFLLGEYAVLVGAPAYILCTEPRFSLEVSDNCALYDVASTLFHPLSPAGIFVKANENFFANYSFRFYDPHNGSGGFGASSSQFLMLYSFYYWVKNNKNLQEIYLNQNLKSLLTTFRDCAWKNIGVPPSGADIAAQLSGYFCYFSQSTPCAVNKNWPFKNLAFYLVRTGIKQATHTHLESLHVNTFDLLKNLVCNLKNIIYLNNENDFIKLTTEYQAELFRLKLTSPFTIELLNKLMENKSILAAKGCGAMGADVIAVFFQRNDKEKIQNYLQTINLSIVADESQLSQGLTLELR